MSTIKTVADPERSPRSADRTILLILFSLIWCQATGRGVQAFLVRKPRSGCHAAAIAPAVSALLAMRASGQLSSQRPRSAPGRPRPGVPLQERRRASSSRTSPAARFQPLAVWGCWGSLVVAFVSYDQLQDRARQCTATEGRPSKASAASPAAQGAGHRAGGVVGAGPAGAVRPLAVLAAIGGLLGRWSLLSRSLNCAVRRRMPEDIVTPTLWVRVDDRLLPGQVTVAWRRHVQPDEAESGSSTIRCAPTPSCRACCASPRPLM